MMRKQYICMIMQILSAFLIVVVSLTFALPTIISSQLETVFKILICLSYITFALIGWWKFCDYLEYLSRKK